MSVRTIYTCEKCGAEQAKPDQFWVVGIQAHCINDRPYGQVKQMQVCRLCLEAFGIYDNRPAEVQAVNPPPTLEDLIIEIVRNQVSEMTGAA